VLVFDWFSIVGAEVMSMVGGERKNRAATSLRKFHYGLVSIRIDF
jgi:hypothetical protein